MTERWRGRPLALLGSVAVLEVGWRTAAEAAGALDPALVPVGSLLVAREVLGAPSLGRFLGSVLLGIATFQALPEVFPDRYLAWGNDVVARAVVAVGAVGASSVFNGLFGRLPYLAPRPVDVGGALRLVALVAGSAAVLTVLMDRQVLYGDPQSRWRPLRSVVRYRSPAGGISPGVPPVGVLVSRVLLVVATAGAALAAVSRLYPVPELLVAGLTAYEGVSGSVGVRNDVAEGFVAGLRAVWAGPRGVLGVSYGVGALLFVVWVDVTYLTGLDDRVGVVSDPVTLAFVLATLGVGTVHVVTAAVRSIERLPGAIDAGERATALPRVPGLMLPAAALFVLFEYVRPYTGTKSYVLTASLPELGVALAAAALAVVPLVRPSLGPRLPLSDYAATVLGPSLVAGVWAGVGIGLTGGLSQGGPLYVLAAAYAFATAALSPFLGYEVFHSDGGTDGPLSELASEALVAVMGLAAVLFVGLVYTLLLQPLLTGVVPQYVFGVVLSSALLPCAFGVGIRVALVPFYLPEALAGRYG